MTHPLHVAVIYEMYPIPRKDETEPKQCYIHWCTEMYPTCVSGYDSRTLVVVRGASTADVSEKIKLIIKNLRSNQPIDETNVTFLADRELVASMLATHHPWWGRWER